MKCSNPLPASVKLINLPQEVGPQAVRKISSQFPTQRYRRNEIDGRNEHTGGGA
jgi:hypothetical protein